MTDEGEPNFGANLQLPTNLKADTAFYKQTFVSMRYKGETSLVIDDNTDLEDLFGDGDEKDQDEKDKDHLFPDGDDGKYIEDEDKDDGSGGFVKPWEILPNGGRKNRRLQTNSTMTNSTLPYRNLQEELNAETSAYIANPVVCKTLGSVILWEGLKPDKYPIYEKDSLLNTNDNFDFGEFD